MRTVAVVLIALGLFAAGVQAQLAPAQARPDFSGTWTFDQAKSSEPGPDGKVVVAAMLGDECVMKQDATTLALAIKFGGGLVNAAYKLDGSESRNMSPSPAGEVTVISHASWDAGKLIILSTSTQADGITVNTRRVFSIDAAGDLIIERTGTPASVVTPSRSVYHKARQSAPPA